MLASLWSRAVRSSSPLRIETRLFMIKRLIIVCVILGLDTADLFYKVHWLGTADSFAFKIELVEYLAPTPVQSVVTDDMRRRGDVTSGWPSFLLTCDDIFPFVSPGSTFFLSAKLANCHVYRNGSLSVLPSVVVISSVRADSLAWAACQLLYHARRPPICGDRMVVNFNSRYALTDIAAEPWMMAPVNSDAEAELLRFLDVVGLSYPLEKVVCVEGFALESDIVRDVFTPNLFGCASPNLNRAAFVGIDATSFQHLQHKRSWLTEDTLAFLGCRYNIRQNSISRFEVVGAVKTDENGAETKTMSLRTMSATNFSSHGLIFSIVIIIDVVLLLTHFFTIAELIKWTWVSPYYRLQRWIHRFDTKHEDQILPAPPVLSRRVSTVATTPAKVGVAPTSRTTFDEIAFYATFSTSFYRTRQYRVLVVATRALSWLVIIPNAVIWTWSDSKIAKAQAYLSSIKSWVLVALVFSWSWRAFVKLWEPMAYRISHRAHITNQEIIVIASLVALAESSTIFTITENKWKVERQRVNDFVSFRGGYLAHGNVYNPTLEFTMTTPTEIAWIIYRPLVLIILWSVLMIWLWILVKCIGRMCWQFFVHAQDPWNTAPYKRLVLEDTLDSPIRALSIVRNKPSMEMTKEGRQYIRPSCYLDYGIMLKTVEFQQALQLRDLFREHRDEVRQSQVMDLRAKMAWTETVG